MPFAAEDGAAGTGHTRLRARRLTEIGRQKKYVFESGLYTLHPSVQFLPARLKRPRLEERRQKLGKLMLYLRCITRFMVWHMAC